MTIPIEYFAVTRENVKLKNLHIAYRVSITAVEVDNVLQYAKVTKVVFYSMCKSHYGSGYGMKALRQNHYSSLYCTVVFWACYTGAVTSRRVSQKHV